RVGRRLDRLRGRRRGWGSNLLLLLLLRLLQQLDPSSIQLDVHGVRLERVQLQWLKDLLQLDVAELPVRLGGLEQCRKVLIPEDRLDLDRQCVVSLIHVSPWLGLPQRRDTQTRPGTRKQPLPPLGLCMQLNARERALCQVAGGAAGGGYRHAVKRIGLVASLAAALLLLWAGLAQAELVPGAQGARDAALAVAPDGSPRVAFVGSGGLTVASRSAGGTWASNVLRGLPGQRVVIIGFAVA